MYGGGQFWSRQRQHLMSGGLIAPPIGVRRAIGPGNDANALLLLHMDGTDGSTTFTDSSASARTITAVGNAQIDTAQQKFGTAAGLFDGAGDALSVPDSDDWAFGTADFTIDTWARYPVSTATKAIFVQFVDASNFQRLALGGSGELNYAVVSGGSTIINVSTAALGLSLDTWYHLAMVRATDFLFFVDGVLRAVVVDNSSVPNLAAAPRIGLQGAAGLPMNGWFDEFRISNVARWTNDFDVAAAAYA